MNEENPILNEIRRRNLKQYELARAVDSDPATINRVIRGERLSPFLTKRIADHLGLPFAECFPKAAAKLEQLRLRDESLRNRVTPARQPKLTPREVETLRKEIKKQMVDLGLDRPGSYAVILPYISARIGRPILLQGLSMAMTGYRNGNSSAEILTALREILETWPPEAA